MAVALEPLVVQLLGDGRAYQQMLGDAQRQTQQAAQQVEAAGARMSAGFGLNLRTIAQGLAALGLGTLGQQAFSGFAAAEAASLKLNAALQANGRDVQRVRADYDQFAAAIQKVTTTDDDAVIGMLQVAESLGLTDNAAKRAVKNAVALAAAKGGEAESYLRVTTALEQGNTEMLGRFLPTLKGIEDETQKAAAAQEMLARMFGVAEAEAQSAGGQIRQLGNEFGNLMEEAGAVVAQFLKPLIAGLRDAISWFQALDESTKQTIVVVAGLTAAFVALGPVLATTGAILATLFSPVTLAIGAIIAAIALWVDHMGGLEEAWAAVQEAAVAAWDWLEPIRNALASLWGAIVEGATAAWEWVKETALAAWEAISLGASVNWEQIRDFIADAILFAEFTLRNFGQVAELVWTTLARDAVQAFNEIEHFFTQVLPALLSWFGRNWQDVFTDAFNFTTTVLSNLASNIVKILSNLPGLVAGTVSFGELWTPLTEGFTSALKELPDIPAREIGAVEQALTEEVNSLTRGLGESFEAFKASKQGKLLDEEGQQKTVKDATNLGTQVGKVLGKGTKEATKELQKFEHALAGSAEAASRIAAFRESFRLDGKEGKGGPAAALAGAGGAGGGGGGAGGDGAGGGGWAAPRAGGAGDGAVVNLLTDIRELLRRQAGLPPVVLQPAGLT
jgi:hypothetical protein